MAIFKYLLTTVTLVSLIALAQCNDLFARSMRVDKFLARQTEASKRYNSDNMIRAQQIPNSQQDEALTPTSGVKNFTFSNPLASREFKFNVWHLGSNCDV